MENRFCRICLEKFFSVNTAKKLFSAVLKLGPGPTPKLRKQIICCAIRREPWLDLVCEEKLFTVRSNSLFEPGDQCRIAQVVSRVMAVVPT